MLLLLLLVLLLLLLLLLLLFEFMFSLQTATAFLVSARINTHGKLSDASSLHNATPTQWNRPTDTLHEAKYIASYRVQLKSNMFSTPYPPSPTLLPKTFALPRPTHPPTSACFLPNAMCMCLFTWYSQLAARRFWPPTAWFRSSRHTLYVLYIRFCCSACALYVKKRVCV